MTYINLNCTGNSGNALVIIESTAGFHDVRVDNVGENGRGMRVLHSSVFFSGSTVFERNIATDSSGGAIYISIF